MHDRDPGGKIARDERRRIGVGVVVTPPVVRPGGRVRVRFVFRPQSAKWNNEGEPLSVWVDGDLLEGDLVHPREKPAHTAGTRVLECELQAGERSGRVRAYALYDVCVDDDGTCIFLRRDIEIPIRVDAGAVPLK